MNKFSIALLVLGTIVGAFGGARLPQADPVVSTIGLAMLAAGCLMVWLQARAHRSGAVSATTDARVFELIRSLPDKLQPLLDQADQLTLDQIADRLAALELETFRPIADASPALLSRMGAESFAAVFGLYAGGERLIARAWSAAVDLHRPETIASLREGLERIRQAVAALPKS